MSRIAIPTVTEQMDRAERIQKLDQTLIEAERVKKEIELREKVMALWPEIEQMLKTAVVRGWEEGCSCAQCVIAYRAQQLLDKLKL